MRVSRENGSPPWIFRARAVAWALVLLAAMALAGCAGAPSPLAPASTSAQQIDGLIRIVFAIAAVVFVTVEGSLVYSVVRFRQMGDVR